MKKVWILVLLFFNIGLLNSCNKEAPAELKIKTGDGEEQTILISCTEDQAELERILGFLELAQLEQEGLSGFHLNLSSIIAGDVVIENEKKTKLSLEYNVKANVIANIKKYITNGDFEITGYTKSEADDLFLDTQYALNADVINDDDFLYLDGIFKIGNNKVKEKRKIDISEFTKEYKSLITSFSDLLNYYNPLNMIPELKTILKEYTVAVSETTRSTFTLKLSIPLSLIDSSLEVEEKLDFYIELGCDTLLPKRFSWNGDALLAELLEKKYDDKYLSSNIQIEHAQFSLECSIEYGKFDIKEITTTDKEQYPLLEAGFPGFFCFRDVKN